MKRLIATAIFTAFAAGALAHGEEPHASKARDYSKAEETPFGRAADPKKAKRTVRVDMTDQMRFQPAQITVKRGDVIRFVPTNKGQVVHEMVLGTMDDLEKHAELMRKFPEMEHDEPYMVHVAPGKSGQMGWQFTKAGEFYYGCLIPGHFEAGMIGKIKVAAQAAETGQKATPGAATTQTAAELSEGEIRRIDKEAKKITIRHGPLVNLDMPGMTMVFQVKDPAMLDKVRVGDKVKFRAEKDGGAFVVEHIEAAK
jgi:uncharacterized cupredoxin-like copper-binding protein